MKQTIYSTVFQGIGNANPNDKGWFANPTALTTAYPTGENGWYATVGSTDTVWVWDADTSAWVDTGESAMGDVVGPSSSTDNAFARFDGTTGKLIQNSTVICDDSGNISGVGAFSLSGNQTFSSTAQRIIGDLSNATRSNRLAVQSSTTNGNSRLGTIPNGTARISGVDCYDGSDPNNAAFLQVHADGTAGHVGLNSGISGTGTLRPLKQQMNNTDITTIGTDNSFSFNQLSTLGIARINSTGGLVGSGRSINNQTGTTYTFTTSDIENLVVANNASAQTYSLPVRSTSGIPVGSPINLFNAGLGTITINKVAGSTDVVDGNFIVAPGAYVTIRARTNGYVIEDGTAYIPYSDSTIIPAFVNAYGSLAFKAPIGLSYPLQLVSITVKARSIGTAGSYSVQVNAATPTGMSGIAPTTSEVTTFFPADTFLSPGQNVTILPTGSTSVVDVEVSLNYIMRF